MGRTDVQQNPDPVRTNSVGIQRFAHSKRSCATTIEWILRFCHNGIFGKVKTFIFDNFQTKHDFMAPVELLGIWLIYLEFGLFRIQLVSVLLCLTTFNALLDTASRVVPMSSVMRTILNR